MANTIMTQDIVAKVFAAVLTNKTVGINIVNMDYTAEFKPSGKGDTVRVRVPAKLRSYDGPDITGNGDSQNAIESYVDVKLSQHKVTPVTITAKDMTLEIADFQRQIADQQVIPIADDFDTYIFGTLPLGCANIVGEAGVTPASDEVVSDAAVRLTEMGCPGEDRNFVLNPVARGALAQYIKATSNQKIAADALRRGFVGRTADMAFWQSNNISRHTNGSFNGTPIVMGASQTGATVVIDGIGGAYTDFLLQGDIITFAGCYAVKPVNGEAFPYLRQFVVTADVDSVATGTGQATVPIWPAIDIAVPGKTCSASPSNDGAVTLFGGASTSFSRNLACHKKAITFASSPLHPLDGGSRSFNTSVDGVSLLFTAGDQIKELQTIKRFDSLFGGLIVNPDMCCMIAGE
ncbi:MAG: hypothetical protein FVQ81_02115 [Candidatus Glassbacteria bacterium]|nr:hypothetical protein [Candidatus Glassbacteria bacterium]